MFKEKLFFIIFKNDRNIFQATKADAVADSLNLIKKITISR